MNNEQVNSAGRSVHEDLHAGRTIFVLVQRYFEWLHKGLFVGLVAEPADQRQRHVSSFLCQAKVIVPRASARSRTF